MKYAPTYLGGVLFLIGLFILASIDLPEGTSTNIFGFSIQDANVHASQVYAALWAGIGFTLMFCGVLVPVVLQWEYSRKGPQG